MAQGRVQNVWGRGLTCPSILRDHLVAQFSLRMEPMADCSSLTMLSFSRRQPHRLDT